MTMHPKKSTRPTRLLVAALLGWLALPVPGAAQVRLGEPAARHPAALGPIRSVRELPDGRVLVADPAARALTLLDFAAGTATQVGREGSGPQEYREPDAVWPLPGDSTLLVDLGNGRLTTVGPDLCFARSIPIHQGGGITSGRAPLLAIPSGVDREGRIYTSSRGGAGAAPDVPAATLLRFPPEGGTPDTVGTVRVGAMRSGSESGLRTLYPVPLSPADAWGVAPDGSLVIARVEDFHVEWVSPDGSVRRGQPVPFTPVPVGPSEREEYLAHSARSGGGLMVMAQMLDGRLTFVLSRGMETPAPEAGDWPGAMPPFHGGTIFVDGDGRAWVHRRTAAGMPARYDIFDREGSWIGMVDLPPAREVVGVGRAGLYLLEADPGGVFHLERHPLPVLAPSLPDTPAGRRLAEWLAQDGRQDPRAPGAFYAPDARTPPPEGMIVPGGWTLAADGRLTRPEIVTSTPTRLAAVALSERTRRWFRVNLQVQPEEPWLVEALSVSAGDPPEAILTEPLDDAGLAREMDSYLHALGSVGAFSGTALVARGDSVLYLGAVGTANRATGESNQSGTRYALGSLNKMWTAVAALRLVEEGRLDLDAPVGRYLPDYPSRGVREQVLLRHLLTHTGGTGDFAGPAFFRARADLRSVADYLALASEDGPAFPPGTRVAYSNAGYLILGGVVEAVIGASYYDYLQEAVFGPAGMTASAFDLASAITPGTAIGYTRMTMGGAGGESPDGRQDNRGTIPQRGSPAGGGYSTATDLLRFSTALMAGKLLGPDATRRLLAPEERSPSGNPMAYGARVFESCGISWSGHGGGSAGMNAELQIDPRGGYTIVVLSNYDPDAAGTVAQKARELVARRNRLDR